MSKAGSLLVLAALTALIAGLTWALQQQAAPRIQAQQQAIQTRALAQVLPAGEYEQTPLALSAEPLSHSSLTHGYRMLQQGQPVAVILQSRTQGYGGPIELLIGIGANGKLLGVKTLSHTETPGLGGKIAEEGSAWLRGFLGTSRNEPPDTAWELKKDGGQFDQMAGATITSRAAINTIHDALRYFDEHRDQLLGGGAHE
ncbi:RnfABCDGE type electron transport complex subunit G [Pseudomonas gingeri]|uniref:Ion-translocating oxidoreductase complex subunit G n=2 Tax=Pseudomonas gingeri TaxID=117681 RepID=A0A7Y8CKI7_9PSED|nr:RnfABCDGE type electron transport complex subunit G [Pseudomonas gingeri]NWB27625.1 RnfABCDGE type electron transport complex subunit G [Pseudomonas gingeri]NWC34237.1 RnfABCDGE type electron transport complex subunit G [Pseudomonas gingeri]NWD48951.1 RnfABCDGE type electron transport complex subunit G [Pseudomonas gingeri]